MFFLNVNNQYLINVLTLKLLLLCQDEVLKFKWPGEPGLAKAWKYLRSSSYAILPEKDDIPCSVMRRSKPEGLRN